MRLLDVGCHVTSIKLPEQYIDAERITLDIDPNSGADIIMDALDLEKLDDRFDVVYASHIVEHVYAHEVKRLLQGFRHVLATEGYADIRTPDLIAVFEAMKERALGLEDPLYEGGNGLVIAPLDVIYGFGPEVAKGNGPFAHKTGFSAQTLANHLVEAGFSEVRVQRWPVELRAIATR